MKVPEKIQNLIRDKKWVGNTCFFVSLFLTASAILFCGLHGITGLSNLTWLSIGTDIIALEVCNVLLYSFKQDKEMSSEYTKTFILLIMMLASLLWTDVASWLVQGIPRLRGWNIVVTTLNYASSVPMIFLFWKYVKAQLELEGKLVDRMDRLLSMLLIPYMISVLCNLFFPIYFTIDAQGVYHRTDLYLLSHLYNAVAIAVGAVGLIISKASMYSKLLCASFVLIPLIVQLLTGYNSEITVQYSFMLVSIVLIYAVLFAERNKHLVSTEKELSIATNIQTDMLPNRFPAFPDRTEFDLFARMDPAKEVGGDFYDFFMIDDDRLAVVIADVSDKGVPAALFMMSAKIIINYCAQSGGTPGEILTEANAELSKKNKHKMFVTVWMGILELSTGMLTCTNAGHEYPVIRGQDGVFRVFRDKHGIPVAAMPKMKYRDYELRMEPGDAIFVYTDGVPEASNEKGDMYGMERLEETLNRLAGENPEGILRGIREDVDQFVKDAKQFDDLTMLCLEYRGPSDGGEKKEEAAGRA
ncbi:MAG: PP2C family protein-serine/threonine phosphatase [Clostridia bacterium]